MLATDRNAVTGVGEPSYTSGAHIWKGTLAILKPKPAIISTTPNSRALLPNGTPPLRLRLAMRWAISGNDELPVKPYTMTIPYSSTAELTALSMRNFIPDSVERGFRRNAANAARGSAVSSSDM